MRRTSTKCCGQSVSGIVRLTAIVGMSLGWMSQAMAGMILGDAPIAASLTGASSSIQATGTVNSSLSYAVNGVDVTAGYQGSVETDGIKLRMLTDNSSFAQLRGGLIDTYTIFGGTPGEQLNFNAIFVIEGTSETLPNPNSNGAYGGHSRISVDVGRTIDQNANVYSGNPVINADFGVVRQTHQIITGNTTNSLVYDYRFVDFTGTNRIETIVPLSVTVGEAFQLAFSVQINHTGDVDTNMLNTAFVDFNLGSEYTVTSTKGFGTTVETAAVPEPASLSLLLGTMGLGFVARRRHKRSSNAAQVV